MAKSYTIMVEVSTNEDLNREEVRVLVDRMLNCGYADAIETLESGEGDLDEAEKVSNLSISVK